MENILDKLGPSLDYLKKDYVLIQAWKKAERYMRAHNWYADTLELDLSSVKLPYLLSEWSAIDHDGFNPEPLKLVPAPKVGTVTHKKGEWVEGDNPKLRPLAHVSIREQTLAVACMMCLADIVETRQGKTDAENFEQAKEKQVCSYGNRLYCDWEESEASFRWGNGDTYSKYYQDYKKFIERSEYFERKCSREGKEWVEVRLDIAGFFDSVTPELLHTKVHKLLVEAELDARHDGFLGFFKKLFSWSWDGDSKDTIRKCSSIKVCPERSVALPQGLVAAGFFANVVLLDFDDAILEMNRNCQLSGGWKVYDYCRYVDDMRFVLVSESKEHFNEDEFLELAEEMLNSKAPGVSIKNKKKTEFIYSHLQQTKMQLSKTMERAQKNMSGPMDLTTAWETTEVLLGLLDVATRPATLKESELMESVFPMPDVREDTVCRFAANRLKKTLRFSRLLSEDHGEYETTGREPTKEDVDLKIDIVARKLVLKFIQDPSNIRLLTVAFDLYPNVELLAKLWKLLKKYIDSADETIKGVCFYCVAELFRAGATQIGFTRHHEELPSSKDCNIVIFRDQLAVYAKEMLKIGNIPWYTRQQAMLYLALQKDVVIESAGDSYALLHFMLDSKRYDWSFDKMSENVKLERFALVMLAIRISGYDNKSTELIWNLCKTIKDPEKLEFCASTIASELPDFCLELEKLSSGKFKKVLHSYRVPAKTSGMKKCMSLLQASNRPENPFRQELALLRLGRALINSWEVLWGNSRKGGVNAKSVLLKCSAWEKLATKERVDIEVTVDQNTHNDIRFVIPSWYPEHLAWRRMIGQLLRAAVTGQSDYTYRYYEGHYKIDAPKYYGVGSNWKKRSYGLFTGRSWLGSEEIPISPWVTDLLMQLLAWPGQRINSSFGISMETPDKCKEVIDERIEKLALEYGHNSSLPFYEFTVPFELKGKLSVAVVQTVLPKIADLKESYNISKKDVRGRQRRHFTTVINSVAKMFDARKTHIVDGNPGCKDVDLLVLPELSIHLEDLSILKSLATVYKCIIFGGLIYHEHARKRGKIVNEGVWILPYKQGGAWRTEVLRQGKGNLAKVEKDLKIKGLIGERSCQWIVRLKAPRSLVDFKMTGAICYDATDIKLASDLRDITDCFIIPALNKDVGLFDNMAAALQYHMYQYIVIANSGEFGGSTAQAPFYKSHERIITHTHGSDQIAINFFDIPVPLDGLKNPKKCKKYKTAPAELSDRRKLFCYNCNECLRKQ